MCFRYVDIFDVDKVNKVRNYKLLFRAHELIFLSQEEELIYGINYVYLSTSLYAEKDQPQRLKFIHILLLSLSLSRNLSNHQIQSNCNVEKFSL